MFVRIAPLCIIKANLKRDVAMGEEGGALLKACGLIVEREVRHPLKALTLFLVKDCCGGKAELCEPLIAELAPCC